MRMIDTQMMQMERITWILIQFYNWLVLICVIKPHPSPVRPSHPGGPLQRRGSMIRIEEMLYRNKKKYDNN